MVAVFAGPQVYPSANMPHSTIALPVALVCCVSPRDGDNTEEMIRSPDDPVSTSTWSMVWQLEGLFDAQIVTVVNGTLASLAFWGPASTLIGATFCGFVAAGVLLDDEVLLLPPPQPASDKTRAPNKAATKNFCIGLPFIEVLRQLLPPVTCQGCMPFRKMRACAHAIERPIQAAQP